MAKPPPEGPVIEAEGLRKSFRALRGGRRLAVDGLDLVVLRGGVHGFLGPNGSGKTTTIRMLLGLVRPDAGSMRLLGRPVPEALPQVIGSVGAVVETPQFFPSFSGRRNLRLLARLAGVRRGRVEEVLTIVGLRERGADRYKAYSPGMKQRLVAKVVGLSLVLSVVGLLVMAAHLAGHYGIAQWRGDLDGATRGMLTSAGITAARGIALGITAGLGGLAVAGLTRHTSAALGLGFAYFLGAELVLRAFWRGAGPWLLTSNVGAWLLHGVDIPGPATNCEGSDTGCLSPLADLSAAHGATYLGVATALLLAAFTIGFRRRDVT